MIVLIKAELKSASMYGRSGIANWYFHGALSAALRIIEDWNNQGGGYYRCDITITSISYVEPEILLCRDSLAKLGFTVGENLVDLRL